MPFLRRRGNTPSETDIRRRTLSSASRPSDGYEDHDSAPSLPPILQTGVLEDSPSLSLQYTHESEPPEQAADHATIESERSSKLRRFSILRHRNASDPQLSLRAKQHAETPPPVPRPPAIIKTAPTFDLIGPKKVVSRMNLAAKFRRSTDISRDETNNEPGGGLGNGNPITNERDCAAAPGLDDLVFSHGPAQAPVYSNGSALSAPNNRQSESSRSDASSTDRVSYASFTTSPKKTQTTSSFFKLRRTKKPPEPLFPLAHLPQKNAAQASGSSSPSRADRVLPRPSSSQSGTISRAGNDGGCENQSLNNSAAAALFVRGGGHRSGQSSPTRANLLRGRSSTMSSVGRDSTDDHLLPPTTRTSTSTGRKSFGDLFSLSRIRQNSELSRQGTLTPATPGSIGSKSNSLQLPRGSFVLPERQDDESPAKYLARLEGIVNRGVIAAALSKGSDAFSTAVLRSYMRSFSFFGDPMDMAIRKLLMEAELPKETQQIDRCLQAFANRYHECNPGIYSSPDQAYFIAFSLLILHTDVFNKNNKHKMQKIDYLKNTRGEGIFDDILGCFYDNISYTPFIHVEDDLDLASERSFTAHSKRKQLLPGNGPDPGRRAAKEPIDPYTLILDGNLDALRPSLKDAMHLEDHYNYLGTATAFNLKDLQNTFFKTGVLQIVSARSRPDAFMTEKTVTNPNEAQAGIVDIKVTKVGLLWRKDSKKRKTRSPWQEWGAILTGAQLYFFRNTSWVKNLMHQHENHLKNGHDGIPIIFKPPLEEFKPDSLMSTHAAVALVDTSYKKHKNAFVYVRQGGLNEVLLADSEEERNDWLAKLNYAAAFRTSGVRMRGVVGANYDGQGRRGMRRLDNPDATELIETPTGPVSIARGHIDHKMAEDIQAARRDGMQRKIVEADLKVEESQKQLEEQLRNARHLQILAPIQPRTREELLLAAARLSAQLKWTRMEIWREKCHRDILAQDLADDEAVMTAVITKADLNSTESTPRPLLTRLESKSKRQTGIEKSPQTPTEPSMSRLSSSAGTALEVESPSSNKPPQTPPQAGVREPSRSWSDGGSGRRGSVSSITDPAMQVPALQTNFPRDEEVAAATGTPESSQDDVDAEERDFLKQAGLWEGKSKRTSLDKQATATPADGIEYSGPADRDRLERSKIRRSLQRTLRESAGHLSHHRSKRGRDAVPSGAGSLEELPREAMLSRGTGSFVVHGKKASVINIGSELQTLSQDEKILVARKQQHSMQSGQPLVSPVVDESDDELSSAQDAPPLEYLQSGSRRTSAASASTATARSFRQLHRKYSSAQAARSVSGARLAVPSDGESEMAVSISDGHEVPQPVAGQGSAADVEDVALVTGASAELGNGSTGGGAETDESDDSNDSDEDCQPRLKTPAHRPVQTAKA